MKLFDAHCHVQPLKAFERAAEAGVAGMAVCGTSSRDWKKVFQTSEKFPQVYPMIGIHPWFVSKAWKKSFQTLEKLLCENPAAGLGETGLDFQERFTNRAEQEASFAAQLDLARELNRPVTVHCVQAWGRLIEILREHPAPRVLLHAFGGSPELIPDLIELNCWFSFCGNVTNPNARRVRASAAAVPADRLLIETDSPDFLPAGCEPPNEPVNLIHVARAVAELRGVALEQLAEITFGNAMRFFWITLEEW
jgi:TatD DNase family protein